MANKRVLVLLPDGVSLRNYVYTRFPQVAKKNGLDLIFLNNTSVDLSEYGLDSVKWPAIKLHPLTDGIKNALKANELLLFENKFKNTIYRNYLFKPNSNGWKNKIKGWITNFYKTSKPTEASIYALRNKMKQKEQNTDYFKSSVALIKEIKPDIVFSTSQRTAAAIAPIEAAKSLGIETVCSIFSWDNLPKSTLLVEASNYFVWSDHMRKELWDYYPFTSNSSVHITGTGQFENHYDKNLLLDKADFYSQYQLNLQTTYLCFSGDDITTSPYDPIYLEHAAQAVRSLNEKGFQLGIIFRKCPVDFSDRFDQVLEKCADLIVRIDPVWEMRGDSWDEKLPLIADRKIQANIAHHTALVMNIGSSMVFDYAVHNKPCIYFNYNPTGIDNLLKDVNVIYNYVHFKSMTSREAVVWINSPEEIALKIEGLIKEPNATITAARRWYDKIVTAPQDKSSERIVESLSSITT